jgi:hypothetical protein
LDVIADEALRRERMHAQAGNYCGTIGPKRTGYDVNVVGLRAEQCFADEFGLSLGRMPRAAGDGGRDFTLSPLSRQRRISPSRTPWIKRRGSRVGGHGPREPRCGYIIARLRSLASPVVISC